MTISSEVNGSPIWPENRKRLQISAALLLKFRSTFITGTPGINQRLTQAGNEISCIFYVWHLFLADILTPYACGFIHTNHASWHDYMAPVLLVIKWDFFSQVFVERDIHPERESSDSLPVKTAKTREPLLFKSPFPLNVQKYKQVAAQRKDDKSTITSHRQEKTKVNSNFELRNFLDKIQKSKLCKKRSLRNLWIKLRKKIGFKSWQFDFSPLLFLYCSSKVFYRKYEINLDLSSRKFSILSSEMSKFSRKFPDGLTPKFFSWKTKLFPQLQTESKQQTLQLDNESKLN